MRSLCRGQAADDREGGAPVGSLGHRDHTGARWALTCDDYDLLVMAPGYGPLERSVHLSDMTFDNTALVLPGCSPCISPRSQAGSAEGDSGGARRA
jgi:hypothetical protein